MAGRSWFLVVDLAEDRPNVGKYKIAGGIRSLGCEAECMDGLSIFTCIESIYMLLNVSYNRNFPYVSPKFIDIP